MFASSLLVTRNWCKRSPLVRSLMRRRTRLYTVLYSLYSGFLLLEVNCIICMTEDFSPHLLVTAERFPLCIEDKTLESRHKLVKRSVVKISYYSKKWDLDKNRWRWSTSDQAIGCWLLNHVIYLKPRKKLGNQSIPEKFTTNCYLRLRFVWNKTC